LLVYLEKVLLFLLQAIDAASALLTENNVTLDQSVVDDLLKYHVAGGANLVLSRLRDGQQ
jgi:hypothetical protein